MTWKRHLRDVCDLEISQSGMAMMEPTTGKTNPVQSTCNDASLVSAFNQLPTQSIGLILVGNRHDDGALE